MIRFISTIKYCQCPTCGHEIPKIVKDKTIKKFGSCPECYISDGYEFEDIEIETCIVEAIHRAHAFDLFQDFYGHSDIGSIFTVMYHGDLGEWTYNPNEVEGKMRDNDAY